MRILQPEQTLRYLRLWGQGLHRPLLVCFCFCFPFIAQKRSSLLRFSYASALQAMALFGLNLERFPAMIGSLTFFIS